MSVPVCLEIDASRRSRFYAQPVRSRTISRGDVALAGSLLVLAVAEGLTASATHRGATTLLLVPVAVSVAFRVINPLVPAAITAVAIPTLSGLGVPSNSTLTLLLAALVTAYSLGAHERTRVSVPGLVLLSAAAVAAVVIDGRDLGSNAPFALLVTVGPFGMGVAMRARHDYAAAMQERAALLARQADEAAATAVAAERRRIARELHDVVAHTLTVIGLQAGGVRRLLLPDQQRERDALRNVERMTREAQEEMRHLLTVLRPEHPDGDLAPQPGLDRLPELLSDAQAAGLAVDLDAPGRWDDLPRGVDLTAYRIIQEALTNCQKHSSAKRAKVQLQATKTTLCIDINDDGPSASTGDSPGYGLIGMQERAALYGGRLDAGPTPHGGFRVVVTLRFRDAS